MKELSSIQSLLDAEFNIPEVKPIKISLDDLDIKASHIRKFHLNGRDWEDFTVSGYVHGYYVGRIKISRGLNSTGTHDDFFLDMKKDPPVPKPFVCYQDIEKECWGNGICGKLIVYANNFFRGKLGTQLYSDTLFVSPAAKKVWKKLEKEGLAVFQPYMNRQYFYGELRSEKRQDGWRML